MPYRLGSTADSWALQLPGCGCTVRCSTPPGLGTAGKSLWGCDQILRTWTVSETGSHTWFSSKAMLSQPCPWAEHTQDQSNTNPPSPINPDAQTLWNWNNHHLSLQPKTPAPWASRCSPGPHCTYRPRVLAHAMDRHYGPRGADHWLFTVVWSRPRPYLAGRVGRAPWAAVPSCCSLGHPGPSWQWAPGPGNAGSRPVLSCSGTWLPAGASWRLCDRTETPK